MMCWMNSAVLALITFLCLFSEPVECERVPYSDAGDESKYGNLTCHSCFRSVDGENCLTMTKLEAINPVRCLLEEGHCMVERYMADGELRTFQRLCAKDCTPGCRATGKSYKVEYCYSCCKENFCNIGNGASDISSIQGAALVFFALLTRLL